MDPKKMHSNGGAEKLFKMYDKGGSWKIPRVFFEETIEEDEDSVFDML